MSIINSFPTTLVNGTVEDATQVMTLFAWIQSQTNGNACPATGGTSILKGDGLGGTQAASGVTDYTPPTTVRNNALAWLGVDTGAVNVLTFTPATALVGYVAGQVFEGIIGTSNTAAATINISGVGAVALRKRTLAGLAALTAGDLIIGTAHQFLYDGTFVQVLTIVPQAFAVGAIYITVDSTNPNTTLGYGTWVAYGTGRTLVAIDAGNAIMNTVNQMFGVTDTVVPTHNHTITDPTHTHTVVATDIPGGSGGSGSLQGPYSHTTSAASTGITINNAGVTPVNQNYQPSIVVYMWRRSA